MYHSILVVRTLSVSFKLEGAIMFALYLSLMDPNGLLYALEVFPNEMAGNWVYTLISLWNEV